MSEPAEQIEPGGVEDAAWDEPAGGETGGGLVALDGRYRLDLTVRYRAFDTKGAVAVGATLREDPDLPLYALVGHPGMPMNRSVLASLRRFAPEGLVTWLADEVVELPGDRGKRLAVVVGRPLGGSIAWDEAHPGRRPSEEKIRRVILPQLMDILEEMERVELSHGAIHPENIFYRESNETQVMLGECFSQPPGLTMPSAFEPIERAMTDPESRAAPTPASDMYAVGVTLLALLQGCDLFYGRDHRELLANRVVRGSYNALSANGPLPAGLITLLRGLLLDDPLQRWSLHEVKLWVAGTAPRARATAAQSKPTSQSVSFAGHAIHTSRMLADTMNRHPDEALELIDEAGFPHWLRDGIFDAPRPADIAATVAEARQRSRGSKFPEKILLAQVCRVLDPLGPVRLGNMTLQPDGLGYSIAMAFHDKREETISVLSDAITSGLLFDFADSLSAAGVDSRKWLTEFSRLGDFCAKKSYGNGLERCLYEMNPELPCQSPALLPYHVTDIKPLMFALADLAGEGKTAPALVDRHMAAFIASRAKGAETRMALVYETRQDRKENIIATLGLLELLQRRYCPLPLPHLSAWFGAHLLEFAAPLHGNSLRDQVCRKLRRLAPSGDLPALFGAVHFPSLEAHDKEQFELAVRELAANDAESERVRRGVSPRDAEAISLGNLLALLISYLVMFGSAGLSVYLVGP